jgi:hypothetical protein
LVSSSGSAMSSAVTSRGAWRRSADAPSADAMSAPRIVGSHRAVEGGDRTTVSMAALGFGRRPIVGQPESARADLQGALARLHIEEVEAAAWARRSNGSSTKRYQRLAPSYARRASARDRVTRRIPRAQLPHVHSWRRTDLNGTRRTYRDRLTARLQFSVASLSLRRDHGRPRHRFRDPEVTRRQHRAVPPQ